MSPHLERLRAVRAWIEGGDRPPYIDLRIVEKKRWIVLYRHLADLNAGINDQPYTAIITANGRAVLGME